MEVCKSLQNIYLGYYTSIVYTMLIFNLDISWLLLKNNRKQYEHKIFHLLFLFRLLGCSIVQQEEEPSVVDGDSSP